MPPHPAQDAAKKALQDMFSDKKDVLAAFDAPTDTGGAGGKGGFRGFGRGGGFGGFGGDFSSFGDGARRFFKGIASTAGALLMFVAVIAVFSLWQPMLAFVVSVVRTVLRLDARGAQRVRQRKMQQVWIMSSGSLHLRIRACISITTQVAEETAAGAAPANMGERERGVLAKYGAEEEAAAQDAAAAAADLDEDL